MTAYRHRYAQVLLLVDQGEHYPGHPDQVGVVHRTVEKIHQRFVLEGL
ncbi:MAG: helix-turn-helix domain containing protein [Gammaproteobacteria bacterium]|nr:helix-turn-helix domain containing protein [Gammaproteobacteria bacterium]